MHLMIVPFAGAVVLACLATAWAEGPAPPGASACSGCHATASGVDTPVPRLAGRKADETIAQMQAFRTGQQSSTVMERIAKGFSDVETRAIAEWYARQKP
jgi:cytochrome subunit of sulfide dehydrogenase